MLEVLTFSVTPHRCAEEPVGFSVVDEEPQPVPNAASRNTQQLRIRAPPMGLHFQRKNTQTRVGKVNYKIARTHRLYGSVAGNSLNELLRRSVVRNRTFWYGLRIRLRLEGSAADIRCERHDVPGGCGEPMSQVTKSELTGVRRFVRLAPAQRLEPGRYVADDSPQPSVEDCFERVPIACPFCQGELVKKTEKAARTAGRVLRLVGTPKNGVQEVIFDPIPRTHIVLGCDRCHLYFTALNTPESPYQQALSEGLPTKR